MQGKSASLCLGFLNMHRVDHGDQGPLGMKRQCAEGCRAGSRCNVSGGLPAAIGIMAIRKAKQWATQDHLTHVLLVSIFFPPPQPPSMSLSEDCRMRQSHSVSCPCSVGTWLLHTPGGGSATCGPQINGPAVPYFQAQNRAKVKFWCQDTFNWASEMA